MADIHDAAYSFSNDTAYRTALAAYGSGCLAARDVPAHIQALDAAEDAFAACGGFTPVAYLRERFALTAFETHILRTSFSLCFDKPFAARFTELSRRTSCADAIAVLYGQTDAAGLWDVLDWRGFLMKNLLEPAEEPFAVNPVLTMPALCFLLGQDYACETLAAYCMYDYTLKLPGMLLGGGHIEKRIRAAARSASTEKLLAYVYGAEGSGRRTQIKAFCSREGSAAVFISAAVFRRERDAASLLCPVFADCAIRGVRPVITDFERLNEEEREDALRTLGAFTAFVPLLFVTGTEEIAPRAQGLTTVPISVPSPRGMECAAVWETLFAEKGINLDAIFFANRFDFTIGRVEEAVRAACANALAMGRDMPDAADMTGACFAQTSHNLGKKAKRVNAAFGWDDLILPARQKDVLTMAADQLRCKHIVYNQWGFDEKVPYGRGLSMLFSGPPGTGKTMAAQVLAREIGLELYRVNLAVVVSKYIGETEKNLNEIFDEALKSRGILLFDEADALFAKRTEVKSSNDKNANMEASFLLQKMEEYDGLAILCTNLLQNVDEAFKRRIKFVVDFPFPDADMRALLWRSIVPVKAPVAPDVDFDFLARFELSGSAIKNVIVNAAFLAAAAGQPLGMRALLAAVKNEFSKSGKVLSKQDFSEYHILMD